MASWDVLFVRESRQVDEVDETEIRRMLAEGDLDLDDCLRRTGEKRWRRVAELKSKSQKSSRSAADGPDEILVAKAVAAEAIGSGDSWEEVNVQTAAPVVAATPILVAAAVPIEPEDLSQEEHEDDEPVRFGRKEVVEPLDMTPMVDVVLLLLLFFMVTASYSVQKILELPKPDPEKKTSARQSRKDLAKEYIIVELDHRNQILVDDEPLKSRSLIEAIKTAAAEGSKNKLFLIADGDSFNGSTVQVMDAANEIGLATPILYSVRTDE